MNTLDHVAYNNVSYYEQFLYTYHLFYHFLFEIWVDLLHISMYSKFHIWFSCL